MDLPIGDQQPLTNTIATQTDEITNIDRRRLPIENKQQHNPFLDIDYNNSPDYLKNLDKDFGEIFIVEATKADPQSKITPIIEKD